ncbi:MAG TPA: hypothetical protein VFS30_18125 [Dehalococcoidia bacterium]|nr:hypothetical protein [Dehalococcoidia bacterium]
MTGTPLWVKLFGLAVAGLVLIVAVLIVLDGGHGPARHSPNGSSGAGLPAVVEPV